MARHWQIIVLILFLAVLAMVCLEVSNTETIFQPSKAAHMQRSDEVIQRKIDRKQAKIDGTWDKPQNPDGYAEFRSMVRTHPEGENTMRLLLDAKKTVETMPVLSVDKDAGLWNWDWLGPGNIGGRVRAILTHPTDPDILWIGSAGGGIWKTTSGGSNWFPLNDFLPSLAITGLAMDPTNSDVIYASTGEGVFTIMGLPGAGIFKSFNGGSTWTQLPESPASESKYVSDIAHHPVNSDWLIACVTNTLLDGEVWCSTNGGDSWTIVVTGTSQPTDVKYDLDNPDVVIVGTTNGAMRSEDAGVNWDVISDGTATGLPTSTGRCEFAFGEGTDVVYASLNVDRGVGMPQGEIWRSLDNGVTWEQRSALLHLGKQGLYDNVIWVVPNSTTTFIVGGVELFVSIDGGASLGLMNDWRQYHTGLSAHADHHVIEPHINYGVDGNYQIYIGNDGGVQIATNGVLTLPTQGWVNLANNLGITQFYHADATPDGSKILGGSQDNDDLLYTASEGSQDWYQAQTGDGTFCAINPVDQDTMYACYPRLVMQRSIDGGLTYQSIFEDIEDAEDRDRALFISPFALDKVAPYRLFAGGLSIWVSNDHGTNWHEILEPIFDSQLCSAVEICPTHGSAVVWVGYDGGRIRKTENFGLNWTAVDNFDDPLPLAFITDIEISPHNPDMVMVTFGGYLSDRVWMTMDSGTSWINISGTGEHALPEIQVNCITYHPSNPNWIYVGTDLGLFASEDLGQTWNVTPRHYLNEGLVYTEIFDLIWHSGDTLVAVSHGRGMFQCRPLDVVWVDLANNSEEDGTVAHPYDTVSEGYDSCGNGTSLIIQSGDYTGNNLIMRKKILVESDGEGTVIIR